MRLLWVNLLTLLSCCLGFSDDQNFQAWAAEKAMESCWGEENNRIYIVNVKKAEAKCKQQDAPELELPPFRSSYKFVNVLTNGADRMDQYKMDQMYNFMKMIHDQKQMEQEHENSYSQYEMMKKMLMKYEMKKMMERFMHENQYEKHSYNKPYSMDSKFDHHKHQAENQFDIGMFRHARQAADSNSNLELGDKLIAKLNKIKQSVAEKVGNMTCVLRELGALDEDNEIDVRSIKEKLNDYTFTGDWFRKRFENMLDNCYEMTSNLPTSIANENIMSGNFGTVNVNKIKYFFNCYGRLHGKLCIDQDTKKKIESNYGPIDNILDQTGWTEHQLFAAFEQLISKNELANFEF